jgi:hypothetical protein
MICSSCSKEVRIFSPEWQNQRAATAKKCPFCSHEVEAVMGASTFLSWCTGVGLAAALLLITLGFPWPHATFLALMFGVIVAIVPSLVLRHPKKVSGCKTQ